MDIPKERWFHPNRERFGWANDPLRIPKDARKSIGKPSWQCSSVRESTDVPLPEAWRAGRGYVVHNEYSERGFQLERGGQGQWVKGKETPTRSRLGRCRPRDEIANPGKLSMAGRWERQCAEQVELRIRGSE